MLIIGEVLWIWVAFGLSNVQQSHHQSITTSLRAQAHPGRKQQPAACSVEHFLLKARCRVQPRSAPLDHARPRSRSCTSRRWSRASGRSGGGKKTGNDASPRMNHPAGVRDPLLASVDVPWWIEAEKPCRTASRGPSWDQVIRSFVRVSRIAQNRAPRWGLVNNPRAYEVQPTENIPFFPMIYPGVPATAPIMGRRQAQKHSMPKLLAAPMEQIGAWRTLRADLPYSLCRAYGHTM